MTLRTRRGRIRPHRVLEDRFATAHSQTMGLEAQRGRQCPKLTGDQAAKLHQRPVARQARTHRAHLGGATRQTAGDQADDPDKNVVDETSPTAHPAQRAGELHRVHAQRVRRRLQTPRLFGRDDNRFQIVQRPRKTRRQAVRQKAERRMALRAIPPGDTRTRRRLALIAPVTAQRAAAPGMVRAPIKPCSAPRPGANILLAGKPRLIAKLHWPWPAGGPSRAGLFLFIEPPKLRPDRQHRKADRDPTPDGARTALAQQPRKSLDRSMCEKCLGSYPAKQEDNNLAAIGGLFRQAFGHGAHTAVVQ